MEIFEHNLLFVCLFVCLFCLFVCLFVLFFFLVCFVLFILFCLLCLFVWFGCFALFVSQFLIRLCGIAGGVFVCSGEEVLSNENHKDDGVCFVCLFWLCWFVLS